MTSVLFPRHSQEPAALKVKAIPKLTFPDLILFTSLDLLALSYLSRSSMAAPFLAVLKHTMGTAGPLLSKASSTGCFSSWPQLFLVFLRSPLKYHLLGTECQTAARPQNTLLSAQLHFSQGLCFMRYYATRLRPISLFRLPSPTSPGHFEGCR